MEPIRLFSLSKRANSLFLSSRPFSLLFLSALAASFLESLSSAAPFFSWASLSSRPRASAALLASARLRGLRFFSLSAARLFRVSERMDSALVFSAERASSLLFSPALAFSSRRAFRKSSSEAKPFWERPSLRALSPSARRFRLSSVARRSSSSFERRAPASFSFWERAASSARRAPSASSVSLPSLSSSASASRPPKSYFRFCSIGSFSSRSLLRLPWLSWSSLFLRPMSERLFSTLAAPTSWPFSSLAKNSRSSAKAARLWSRRLRAPSSDSGLISPGAKGLIFSRREASLSSESFSEAAI